jgi:hypothetical protein
MNTTNFAIGEISDSLSLMALGKSASYFIQRQSDLHRQATVSRLRIDGEMECSKRRQTRVEEAGRGNAAGTNAGKKQLR